MKVWSVNTIYSPWISHGYEPLEFFSSKELAERYKAYLDAEVTPEQKAEPEKWGYGFDVDEWEVDNPDIIKRLRPPTTATTMRDRGQELGEGVRT